MTRVHLHTAIPGPRSRELAARLAEVEAPGFTPLEGEPPIFWASGEGATVTDVDGNVFIDMVGAFGVAACGHAAPGPAEAAADQASRLVAGMGDVQPPEAKVRLLEALVDLAPDGLDRAVLSSDGADAVETALKAARLATGKPGVVAFSGAYHGLTYGTLALTNRACFRHSFEGQLGSHVWFVPWPDPLHPPKGVAPDQVADESLDALEVALASTGPPVGAVIAEPIQGRGGIRVPPPGFLARVAAKTRKAGALLILDEILTGLGRTGTRWRGPADGVTPDLLCCGKALGGGAPLSACLGTPGALGAFPTGGEAIHTHTHMGNPLACAMGVAALETITDRDLANRAAARGRHLRSLLEGTLDLPHLLAPRGAGLMLGLPVVHPDTRDPAPARARAITREALHRGLILLPTGPRGHVLQLTPPLTVDEATLEEATEILAEAARRTS